MENDNERDYDEDDNTPDPTTGTPPATDPIPEEPASGGAPEDPGNTQTPPGKQAYINQMVVSLKEMHQQILRDNKDLTARDDITEEEWQKYAEELYNIEQNPDPTNNNAFNEKVTEIMQRTIPGMSSAYGIPAENTPSANEQAHQPAEVTLNTQATGDLFNDLVSLIGELFARRYELMEAEIKRRLEKVRAPKDVALHETPPQDAQDGAPQGAKDGDGDTQDNQGAKDGDAPQTQSQEIDPNLLAFMYRNGRGDMG